MLIAPPYAMNVSTRELAAVVVRVDPAQLDEQEAVP
jgi:uncharacterized RmlC-like cupin family protein